MVSSFDIAKLRSLLKHFYTLTNIRITVFDENYKEIVAYPPNISSFCKIIRTDQDAANNCVLCDRNACLMSKNSKDPQIYNCHAGLTEVIVPIYLGEIIIGYLIMAHISPYQDADEGWKNIQLCCKDYDIDMDALKSAFIDRKYFSYEYIYAASQIMNTVASYICITHMATLKHDSLLMQIDRFISQNIADGDLSIKKICDHFEISRSKLYKIADQNYGIGVSEYIKNQRIEKAKDLLLQTNLPIHLVADSVGIADYNYFSKMFKKAVGIPPREFRNANV